MSLKREDFYCDMHFYKALQPILKRLGLDVYKNLSLYYFCANCHPCYEQKYDNCLNPPKYMTRSHWRLHMENMSQEPVINKTMRIVSTPPKYMTRSQQQQQQQQQQQHQQSWTVII